MNSNRVKPIFWLVIVFVLVVGGSLFYLIRSGFFPAKDNTSATVAVAVVPKEKDHLAIGVGSGYSIYPDCVNEVSYLAFNSALFDSLVTFDRENRIVPLLATKWDNPDDLTWRFYLSPKAKFSNGDPLTSEDVKFTYDYIIGNKNLQLSAALPILDSVNVINDQTIEFKTKTPDPILLNRLALTFLILSKKDVEANGLKTHLGSGPYLLTSQTDAAINLSRNENYWGVKPKVKNVTYKILADSDKIAALENGSVDFISSVYSKDEEAKINSLKIKSNFETATALVGALLVLDLDSSRDKSPYIDSPQNPLKDKRVREAIYMGMDIKEILKANPGSAELTQLAYPGLFGYNPNVTRPVYNLSKAKALLKEAGYENGFSITIDYIGGSGADELFKPVADELAKLNIKTTMNGLAPDVYFPKVMKKDSSATIIGLTFGTEDVSEVLDGIIHTPTDVLGQENLLGYSNSGLDIKIEEIDRTLNQQTRQQKIQEALKLTMDDVPKIPLFQGYSYFYFKKDIYFKPRLDASYRVQEFAGK